MSKRKKESRPAVKTPGAAVPGPAGARSPTEFTPDYSYVRKDLRRIATIAGGILAALLILAIVLN